MAKQPSKSHVQVLADRIRERLAAKKRTPRSVSISIGANASYVGQILLGRGGMPSADKLQALAEELETTTDYLLGKVSMHEQPISEVSFRDAPRIFNSTSGERLKVLGTGFCADLHVSDENGNEVEIEQLMLETDHVVRIIERPAALWNSPDAYAIYFHGSSMEDRFYQGEIGVVDPRRPPSPGDFVVVQLSNGDNDQIIYVLVKQLVRMTSGFVELAQLNPAQKFRIPRGKVARMHRILSINELLGG